LKDLVTGVRNEERMTTSLGFFCRICLRPRALAMAKVVVAGDELDEM
jgi:hypothetical protein